MRSGVWFKCPRWSTQPSEQAGSRRVGVPVCLTERAESRTGVANVRLNLAVTETMFRRFVTPRDQLLQGVQECRDIGTRRLRPRQAPTWAKCCANFGEARQGLDSAGTGAAARPASGAGPRGLVRMGRLADCVRAARHLHAEHHGFPGHLRAIGTGLIGNFTEATMWCTARSKDREHGILRPG